MKLNSKQFASIFRIAWRMFEVHKGSTTDGIDHIYLDENTHTLSYIEDTYPEVTEEVAKVRLSAWIRELTDQEPKLIIYTCRDNAEICLFNKQSKDWVGAQIDEGYGMELIDKFVGGRDLWGL